MNAKEAWSYIAEKNPKEMSKEFAKQIIEMYDVKGQTWRSCAYEITEGEDGNQLLGMWLYEKAKKVLE